MMNIKQLLKLSILLILPAICCLHPALPLVSNHRPFRSLSGLTLQLTPNEGEPGTEVNVTGSGWTPRTKVEVYFDSVGFGQRSKDVITTVTDDQGRFETIVISPTGLLWRQRDNLVVTARASKTGQQVSTLFTNLVCVLRRYHLFPPFP